MKWCVQFPEEEILIMRPCLKRACTGNKHAAALLSYLLYHVSISHEFRKTTEQQHHSKEPSDNVQNMPASVSIYKTQQQILAEMDYDISERTLRSIAIPILIACGYIDIDGSKKTTRYTVHLTHIQAGIMAHPTTSASLPTSNQPVQSGRIAASYRQSCHHQPAKLPPHTGKIAEFSGNLAGTKNGDEGTSGGSSSTILCEDKSKSNKDITKRRKEATKESTTYVSTLEAIKAAALPLSQEMSGSTATPTHQACRPLQIQAEPRPEIHKPRTAEAVVQLIEALREQVFGDRERPGQLQAAQKILELKPQLRLSDIQEAWLHGSDTYWKRQHNNCGMTVLDLAHHDSRGKPRVMAVLEHKRAKEQKMVQLPESRAPGSPPQRSHASSSPPGAFLAGKEAQELALQVIHDGKQHGYPIQAQSICKDNAWLVSIQLEQHKFCIHNASEWEQRLPQIHQVMQLKKRLNNTTREEQESWSA